MAVKSAVMSRIVSEEKGLTGVNLIGYLQTESGVGEAARGYWRALQVAGIPANLIDISGLQTNRSQDQTISIPERNLTFDINLVCADVELHYTIMSHLGEEFFNDRYNIGIWAWELPGFPQKWYDRFAYYDEIWVGTSFIAKTLAAVAPVPVVRIPPALEPPMYGSRAAGRSQLGVAEEEVVYLFMFDFHSHFQRKNPLAVIEAFKLAFAPIDPARLIIKCVNSEECPESFGLIQTAAQGHRISIHTGYWTASEVRDLMAACDVYVSLHRAEGTGLTITEAMALGKPVVATGWSGNMDFMDISNSYPVSFKLVELQQNIGPYRAGEVWAEPSIEHAAERMRYIFEHPDEARKCGQAARAEIVSNYSAEVVGHMIHRRLEAVAIRRHLEAFGREMRADFLRYQQLPMQIREVIKGIIPQDTTMIVVSKGDDALLELDGRAAWHFPQNESGVYAGYYPADSAAAIEHLEKLRARGGKYLLFPHTASWWLEHYKEFADYLDTRYKCIHSDEYCLIYHLSAPPPADLPLAQSVSLELLVAGMQTIEHCEAGVRQALFRSYEQGQRWGVALRSELRQLQAAVQDQGHLIDNIAGKSQGAPGNGSGRSEYQQIIHEVREVVEKTIPRDGTVLVVSKGDEELLSFNGPQGWHFPRRADGVYAGYYPADSAAAIGHLEELRARGGQYLLFPSTASWWLDHYQEFRRHLDTRYTRIGGNRCCTIYHLE